MKPQNNDFISYIYILYYQSNIHSGFVLPVAIIAKCEEKIFLAQKTLFGEYKWWKKILL